MRVALRSLVLILVIGLVAVVALHERESASAPTVTAPSIASPTAAAPVLGEPAVPATATDEDRLGSETVVAAIESAPDADGVVLRTTIVRTDFKYPLVRVEDRVRPAAAGRKPEVVGHLAMVADHLLVRVPAGQTEAALGAAVAPLGAQVRSFRPMSHLALVAFDGSRPEALDEMRARLAGAGFSAEPDYIVHAIDAYLAGDLSPSLWSLNNTASGASARDINAPEAWGQFRTVHPATATAGSRTVFVAVIDTGIGYGDQDFAGNYDGADGYDYCNNDSNPLDDNGHGTHVSGTIGAAQNSYGVVGVCPEVTLIALKFLNSRGSGALSDAISCIDHATDLKLNHGVNIVASNNSWGGGGFTQSLMDAISRANDAGILFVAAAGNSSIDMDKSPQYPASYAVPNVISVAAIDKNDAIASFTNYGATQVDLFAPGVSIYSDYVTTSKRGVPTYGFATLSGTSMATPHVTGSCALLAAYNPNLTAADLKALLLGHARAVPALAGKCLTGGTLDLFGAIMAAPLPPVGSG